MKIDIENFQSLKKAELTIEKFTALLGRNNLGKSATTRAVRSVIRNRGDFRRGNAKSNKVTLEFDGLRIARIKGSNISYEINGQLQQSIGREVPQEIIDAGLKPIILNKDRVYIQFPNQFEKVFLLNQPNSVIAETISKIAKIDVVNNALRLVSRDRQRDESTLKIRKEDLEDVKSRLKRYERVDELNITSEEILSLKKEIAQLEEILAEVVTFITSLDFAASSIRHLSKSDDVSITDTTEIEVEYKTLCEVQDLFVTFETSTNLVGCLSKIDEVEIPVFPLDLLDVFNFLDTTINSVTDVKEKITHLEKIGSITIPETSTLEEEFSTHEDIQSFEVEYSALQKSISEIEQQLERITQESKTLEEEISSIKKEGICPFKEAFGCKETW